MYFEYRDTGIGDILLDTILETGQMNGIEKSLVILWLNLAIVPLIS